MLIDTEESEEVIAQMSEVAERACMAAQTVINAVPVSTVLIINGNKR